MKNTILIVGATGLVGRSIVSELAGLQDVALHIIARNSGKLTSPSVHEHILDVQHWPQKIAEIKPDVVISCLGTTWKKAGKDQAAFRAVDYDLVIAVAKAARAAGAQQMIAVSSVGAAPQSNNFYLRTKGETEQALAIFDFARLDILRPGLLTGERDNDRRLGERIGILLSPIADIFLQGKLRRYRSIPATKVARAIATLALNRTQYGQYIHMNDAISVLAS